MFQYFAHELVSAQLLVTLGSRALVSILIWCLCAYAVCRSVRRRPPLLSATPIIALQVPSPLSLCSCHFRTLQTSSLQCQRQQLMLLRAMSRRQRWVRTSRSRIRTRMGIRRPWTFFRIVQSSSRQRQNARCSCRAVVGSSGGIAAGEGSGVTGGHRGVKSEGVGGSGGSADKRTGPSVIRAGLEFRRYGVRKHITRRRKQV
jgi:hypothetical protein